MQFPLYIIVGKKRQGHTACSSDILAQGKGGLHSSSRERGVAGVAFHSTLIVNQSSTYSTAVTSQLPPQRSSEFETVQAPHGLTLGSGHTHHHRTAEDQPHSPLS